MGGGDGQKRGWWGGGGATKWTTILNNFLTWKIWNFAYFLQKYLDKYTTSTVFNANTEVLITMGASHIKKSRHGQTSKVAQNGFRTRDLRVECHELSQSCQMGGEFEHFRILTIGVAMKALYPLSGLSQKGIDYYRLVYPPPPNKKVLFFYPITMWSNTHNIIIFAINMWSSCTFYHDFRIQDVV